MHLLEVIIIHFTPSHTVHICIRNMYTRIHFVNVLIVPYYNKHRSITRVLSFEVQISMFLFSTFLMLCNIRHKALLLRASWVSIMFKTYLRYFKSIRMYNCMAEDQIILIYSKVCLNQCTYIRVWAFHYACFSIKCIRFGNEYSHTLHSPEWPKSHFSCGKYP